MDFRRKSTRAEWYAFCEGLISGIVVTLIAVLITLAALKEVFWVHV